METEADFPLFTEWVVLIVRRKDGRKDRWSLDVRFGKLGGVLSSHWMLLMVGGSLLMMKSMRIRCLFGYFGRGDRVGWCIRPYPR